MKLIFSIQNIRRENQYTFYVKRDRENTNDFSLFFRVVEFACYGVFVYHENRFVFFTPIATEGKIAWLKKKDFSPNKNIFVKSFNSF
jgi:hypothetical protein